MKLTKLKTVPAIGISAAAMVLGGSGIALASGGLNIPFTGHDNRSQHAPAAPETNNPGVSKAGTVIGGPSADQSSGAEAADKPSAQPSPSLDGLCVAYQHGAFAHGTSQAFAVLTRAAGGVEGVAGYCTALIGAPSAQPSHPAKPSQAPTPTHPVMPTQAVEPTPPTLPTQAAEPTIPDHPTPPAH
jgi:hypothetical protein